MQSIEFSEPETATVLKDISLGHEEGHGNAHAPTRGHSYPNWVLIAIGLDFFPVGSA